MWQQGSVGRDGSTPSLSTTGNEDDPTYQWIVQLRNAYGPYQVGKGDFIYSSKGDPVPPAWGAHLIHLPHKKGTTPDCEKPPTKSELADNEDGNGFTGIWALGSDSESGSKDAGHKA